MGNNNNNNVVVVDEKLPTHRSIKNTNNSPNMLKNYDGQLKSERQVKLVEQYNQLNLNFPSFRRKKQSDKSLSNTSRSQVQNTQKRQSN